MNTRRGHGTATGFMHRHFLRLLVGAYALAGVVPAVGRWLSGLAETGTVFGHAVRVSAPAAMLGALLFAAGFAVKGEHLRGVFRRPLALAVGLVASVAVPVLVILAAAPFVSLWHDPVEARDVLVGLAVVAAMPVAGSAAGWSRAADGDCALALGLVLLSTLLSPLTTPLAFGAAARFVSGDAGGVLSGLAGAGGAGAFVVAWVVLPTALGLVTRWAVGGTRADAAGPWAKRLTAVVLLVLCYANASVCLPGVVAEPDWDFLALVAAAAGLMCGGAFAAGFGAARAVRADPARRAALVFGVGMANNGAGLALAAGALTGCPMALLPVVAVNLVQHLAAGLAEARLRRAAGRETARDGAGGARGGFGAAVGVTRGATAWRSGPNPPISPVAHGKNGTKSAKGNRRRAVIISVLPCLAPHTRGKPVTAPTPEPTSARPALRILVVDDDPDFTDSLAWLLRYRGHDVDTAGNALDAVAAFVAHRFDVIFLDVRLPGLTGHDLARWVRGHAGAWPPYLIAVTGYGSAADRRAAADIGIDLFLLKPLDPAHLDDLLAGAGR
ncbi:MAG: response regulator [Planctomycetes bacterium]|nr:response regulator [Planctomycetota bacterium]